MAEAKVWADEVIPGEGLGADVLRVAAANLLLILCARVVIPLPWTPVPITGQTFGVMLVAVLLGPTRAAAAVGLYLLEGFVGLPVFQPFGLPGPLRFAGPTGGYLLSCPAAAYVIGWLAQGRDLGQARRSSLALLGPLLCGEAIVFLGGCAWLAVVQQMGWSTAFAAGVIPFLPGELVKMAAVLAVVRGLCEVTTRAGATRSG